MPRAKTGTVRTRKHKKVLKAAKGYYGSRSKLFRRAHEAYIKAGEHKFAGRKLKKRDIKKLWIIRINAALKEMGLKYSDFVHKLRASSIKIDRKILSELAVKHPDTFREVVNKATKS